MLVQASPWSEFKYTNPDKGSEVLSFVLDFVHQGGVRVAMAHLGKKGKGHLLTVKVHECTFILCGNLKGMSG